MQKLRNISRRLILCIVVHQLNNFYKTRKKEENKMKILLSINKKAIALLLSFLVILSSFSLIYTSKVSADTTSRSTNTKMMYQDPFTASGSHIVATKSIAGTDIKKGSSRFFVGW